MSKCTHTYELESPSGNEKTPGVCSQCGDRREFDSWHPSDRENAGRAWNRSLYVDRRLDVKKNKAAE